MENNRKYFRKVIPTKLFFVLILIFSWARIWQCVPLGTTFWTQMTWKLWGSPERLKMSNFGWNLVHLSLEWILRRMFYFFFLILIFGPWELLFGLKSAKNTFLSIFTFLVGAIKLNTGDEPTFLKSFRCAWKDSDFITIDFFQMILDHRYDKGSF